MRIGPKKDCWLGNRYLSLAVGTRFNRLVVVCFSHIDKQRKANWLCRCDCGNTHTVTRTNLLRGLVQSCGCFRREVAFLMKPRLKHGHTWTSPDGRANTSRTYKSWSKMLQRCYNRNDKNYFRYYSSRGITVAKEWHDFSRFLFDMGERPAGRSLDRINNDGNYEPGNCRWATGIEQANNRRKPKKHDIVKREK